MRGILVRSLVGVGGTLGLVAFGIGCEDPPPPTQAGAFAVTLQDSGASCGLMTKTTLLGVVGGTGDPDLISNGADGVKVTCTVEAASGGFHVAANLDDKATVQINVPVLTADNAEDSPAEGTVNFVSTDTGGQVYSSQVPCEFWTVPDDGQFVRAGEAWITFSCAEIENEGDICRLATSYVAVRNCTGAVTEEDGEETTEE
jgi:hypothetical protein